MIDNPTLIVFILAIIICLLTADPLILLLIASVVTNAVLLYPNITKQIAPPLAAAPITESFLVNEHPVEYSDERAKYIAGYTLAYDQPRPLTADDTTHNIDNMNTMLWRARTVDKKRSDGWATKDANYYKYHFADELNYEENKIWHGRDDY